MSVYGGFAEMMHQMLGQELKEQEVRGLYNVSANSHDELTLTDFLQFFRQHDDTAKKPLSRIAVKGSNTVTTVSVSGDEQRVRGRSRGRGNVRAACCQAFRPSAGEWNHLDDGSSNDALGGGRRGARAPLVCRGAPHGDARG